MEPSPSAPPPAVKPWLPGAPPPPEVAQGMLNRITDAMVPAQQRRAELLKIKSEMVGNSSKREDWVEAGLLEAFIKVLAPTPLQIAQQQAHQNGLVADGETAGETSRANAEVLSDDEVVRLAALHVLSSLSKGGPAFIWPIHQSGVLEAVLGHLSVVANPPKIVLAALFVVDSVAEAAERSLPRYDTMSWLTERLFSSPCTGYLQDILRCLPRQPLGGSLEHICLQQTNIVTKLIATLCHKRKHQEALADGIILQHLATLVVSNFLGQSKSYWRKAISGQATGMPRPAPAGIQIWALMDAISAIIFDSKYRTLKFLWSPALVDLFLRCDDDKQKTNDSHWAAQNLHGMAAKGGPQDYGESVHLEWRELYAGLKSTARNHRFVVPDSTSPEIDGDEDGNLIEVQVVPWLIYQMRQSSNAMDKTAIAGLIICVIRPRPDSLPRELHLCSLMVVPTLVEMLMSYNVATLMEDSPPLLSSEDLIGWYVLTHAPVTISRLSFGFLSFCTFARVLSDIKAPQILIKVFIKTHTTPYVASRVTWWNQNARRREYERSNNNGLPAKTIATTLGAPGISPVNVRIAQVREAALVALQMLTGSSDDRRQAAAKDDLIPCTLSSIKHSLRQIDDQGRDVVAAGEDVVVDKVDEPFAPKTPRVSSVEYGGATNSKGVLIAACGVMQMMSRSISVLRTSHPDASRLFYELLDHEDVEVRIAAAAAIDNLVTRQCVGRGVLIEQGISNKLCELSRSPNLKLQLNAIWGIKHLVDDVPVKIRIEIISLLGSEWILQNIRGDDDGSDDEGDVDMAQDPPPDNAKATTTDGHTIHERLAAKLEAYWKFEEDPGAKEDDMTRRNIQEQFVGLLRNLFLPAQSDGGANQSVVNRLFSEVKADQWFDALRRRLQPVTVQSSSAWPPSSRPSRRHRPSISTNAPTRRVASPWATSVSAVIFTLVNLTATSPEYRDLVLEQKRLIKIVYNVMANYVDDAVRQAALHLALNLVDGHDGSSPAQRDRIEQLRSLGVLERVEAIRGSADRDTQHLADSVIDIFKNGGPVP